MITFYGKKIIELLGDLLNWLFVPNENFFNDNIEGIKEKISKKIPYQDYINMFETIKQVQSGDNIKIELNEYNVGNNLTINSKNFIDFSWITKYKDTWYAWVRGFLFIFLIIYNINQIMKLFRGYNIAEGFNKIDKAGGGSK